MARTVGELSPGDVIYLSILDDYMRLLGFNYDSFYDEYDASLVSVECPQVTWFAEMDERVFVSRYEYERYLEVSG